MPVPAISSLSAAAIEFTRERHLATLTLVRPDGSPHVTPVGFTLDCADGLARVITWSGSVKARLVESNPGLRAAICQVDGGRWMTFEGTVTVTADPGRCADAVARYAERYRQPGDRGDERRAIELVVDRVLGSKKLS